MLTLKGFAIALGLIGAPLIALAAAPTSPTSSTTSLVLRYQASETLPVPRVPGTTSLTLPLIQRSRISHQKFPGGVITAIPGTPYARLGESASYVVPDPTSQFISWVQREFHQRGDGVVSQSTLGNGRSGVGEQSLSFSSASNPALVISVTVYSPRPGMTCYAYWGEDTVNPPRPLATKILFSPVRLQGTVTVDGVSQEVTSDNRRALIDLRNKINALHQLQFGFCPLVTRVATMTFESAQGKKITVRMEDGCSVSIARVTFVDNPAAPLWRALQQAIHSS